MGCYDDSPFTTEQRHDMDCRAGRGHLQRDLPAGVRRKCSRCAPEPLPNGKWLLVATPSAEQGNEREQTAIDYNWAMKDHAGEMAEQTNTQALRDAKEALDSIWAAIGDALCSGKGIEKNYANSVAWECRKASQKITEYLRSTLNAPAAEAQPTTATTHGLTGQPLPSIEFEMPPSVEAKVRELRNEALSAEQLYTGNKEPGAETSRLCAKSARQAIDAVLAILAAERKSELSVEHLRAVLQETRDFIAPFYSRARSLADKPIVAGMASYHEGEATAYKCVLTFVDAALTGRLNAAERKPRDTGQS